LLSVQMLRAVAASSVVICHFSYISNILSGRPNDPIYLYSLASGVDLFFVISGFIMVHSSGPLFGVTGSWMQFAYRRIARIVPLYWVMTAFVFAYSTPDLHSVIKSLFFIPYVNNAGVMFPVLAAGWTLNYEMFFYALFAATLFLRREVAVAAACGSLVSLVIAGRHFAFVSPVLIYWMDPILLEFCFGMSIAVLHEHYKVRFPAAIRIMLIGLGLTAIWFYGASGTVPSGWRFLFWGVPAAAIFAGVVLGNELNFGALRSPAKLIGDASYTLYLVHPVVAASIILFSDRLVRFGTKPVLALGVLISFALALGIFLVFERRLMALVKGRSVQNILRASRTECSSSTARTSPGF
jgi:exopolysaccharide production protein ExoZ